MRGTDGSDIPVWLIFRGEGYILVRNKDIIGIYNIQRTAIPYLHALRPEASAD